MSHINFIIPQNKSELLSENDEQYYVRNIVSVKEIQPKLREAKQCFKDEGPEFILDYFSTFYSVLHHADTLQMDVLMKAYEDLHKAVQGLNNVLGFLLEDKDNLNEELTMKYLNVIKMLLYIYTNIVITVEQKIESRKSQTFQPKKKSRKKTVEDELEFGCDKKAILLALNNIVQRELNLFWDPPVVEETFVNMIAEVCYRFLESPSIKTEKELRIELFSMLGTLIKSYNHGMTFVVRIVQLIKIHEHLVQCVPPGIQLLVQNYNCKSLVRDFVQEVTEWQTDEKFQDAQGTRNCSAVLFEMANLMPNLMIPEVMYLNRYLCHDSYTLRNSVLHVITEVVLNVLTKADLTEEQRDSRDEFLSILEEHITDVSALVRSKVFQHWTKLQQENAIPIKIQARILEKAVMHLRDKAANVRKCAANCVTAFLSHNIYGAELKLSKMQEMYAAKKEIYDNLNERLGGHLPELKETEEQWLSKEEGLRAVIKEKLNEGLSDKPPKTEISEDNLSELVRLYVLEDKFVEAFELCRSAGSTYSAWQQSRDSMDKEEQVDLYLSLIRFIFTCNNSSLPKLAEAEGNAQAAPSEEDLKQLGILKDTVDYLEKAVTFLTLIDSAIKPMADLLESASIGDMTEAIEFFVAAYKFSIDNALLGVLEMLRIMQRNEQERKDHIINAFKTIYLTTDSTTMKEHTIIIVNRLIDLLQTVPYENFLDLCIIISEWVSKGILDNSIIDTLWQYFTKKIEVSDAQSRAALNLLTMAARGRRTIATRNIKLISTIVFGERGKSDVLLVRAGCEMLQVAGHEKQDITDKNPPFRIKITDPIWQELSDILIDNFNAKSPYYNGMMSSALDCIYRLCSKPEKVCEDLIQKIINSLVAKNENNNSKELDSHIILQCVHMLGEIAIKQLNFLDESVYKELKRRNYIREERKADKKKGGHKKLAKHQNASASNSKRFTGNSTNQSIADESVNADESTLEGAQADDTDAEFILNVLENNTVTESSGLGKLAYLITSICERPNVYDDRVIQGTAVIALLRYMTVSSRFCQKNLQLIFTILEKTKYPEVKSNILIHCSDLLERFPNLIEPWTPRIYERLRDNCTEVRITAFFMLANLILRDMIRVQGYISEMAYCIVDPEEQLKDMSKNFFTQLSHKANNLYNVLPDIFSHLLDLPSLEEENLRFIMKFLFGLIDKNKQMESLVDRFCSKFRLTEDDYKCRNIAFCLSLIQFNDKGLKRLSESFPCYKNTILNDDVYAIFKQILNTCSKSLKNEIKELANEIEEKINSVFETDENGQPRSPQPNSKPGSNHEKSAFKKPRGRAPRKKAKKKSYDSDSGSDEEEKENKENTPKRPLRRTQRTPRKTTKNDSDSDSD